MSAVVLLVVILLLTLLLIALVVYAIFESVPHRIGYIPLPRRAVEPVMAALGLSRDSQGLLLDLGCGDGRVMQAALRTSSMIKVWGYEINPFVARLAKWKLRSGAGRDEILRTDFMAAELSGATYIFTYLNPPMMAALEPKLERELPPGTRLVSCDFPLPNRTSNATITIGPPGQRAQKLYRYDF